MFRLLLIFTLVIYSLGIPHQGFPPLDNKIIGGEAVEIEDFPYQVSFQVNGRHRCGGSIISERFVITAAHCTDRVNNIRALSVYVGSKNVYKGGRSIKIRNLYQHPNFIFDVMDYDISILELTEPIEFSNKASPVRLPNAGDEPQAGIRAWVSGWGRTENGLPRELRAVEVPVITREACKNAYKYVGYRVTPRMFCAGYLGQGGKDSCQGDSGGPLVSNGVLIGIVSWGEGCAEPYYPGVYTNVANVRDYIKYYTGV